jgi:SAM-dependent methyltransferase
MSRWLLRLLKGTILHPQWMTDRFHSQSKKCLEKLSNAVMLDIGSGNASYLRLIHLSNTLYTIDYPATNKNYHERPTIFSDARCLPVANAKVDVVLLFEVLEHVVEIEKVLKEIRRVLRSDGEFYLSVPFIYPIHDAPSDYWRFTVHGITEILFNSGFETTKLITHGNTLVASLQMFNLGLLEISRDIYRSNRVFGLLVGLLVYPITLIINLFAWPLLYLPLGKAGNFGYFLIARCKEN